MIMSSYRSSYVPWQSSTRDTTNNRSSNDRLPSTFTANRYSSTGISGYKPFNSSIANNSYSSIGGGTGNSVHSPVPSSRDVNTVSSLRRKYSSLCQNTAKDVQQQQQQQQQETQKDTALKGSAIKSSSFKDGSTVSRIPRSSTPSFTEKCAKSPGPIEPCSATVVEQNISLTSRSTSPTPPANSVFLRTKRLTVDNAIKFEKLRSPTPSSRRDAAVQTTDENSAAQPKYPGACSSIGHSRVASLTSRYSPAITSPASTKFRFGGDLSSKKQSPISVPDDNSVGPDSCRRINNSSNFSTHHQQQQNSTNATPVAATTNKSSSSFLPIRTVSTRPNGEATSRTTAVIVNSSPINHLRKSFNSLKLEDGGYSGDSTGNAEEESSNKNDSDSETTESDSSYEENYPNIKMGQYDDRCSAAATTTPNRLTSAAAAARYNNDKAVVAVSPNSDLSDKPPKYPPAISSPKVPRNRLCSSSNGSCTDVRNCATTEDVSPDERYHSSGNIPSATANFYPIRKMDSAESPWWMNENGEITDNDSAVIDGRSPNSSQYFNNTADSSCGSSNNNNNNNNNNSDNNLEYGNDKEITNDNESGKNGFGYASSSSGAGSYYKDGNGHRTTTTTTTTTTKIRKMDSEESGWSCEDENESKIVVDSRDADSTGPAGEGESRYYPSIYRIRKFDSGEKDWWNDQFDEAATEDTGRRVVSDNNKERIIAGENSPVAQRPAWWDENDDQCENYKKCQLFKIRRIESIENYSEERSCNDENEATSDGRSVGSTSTNEQACWMSPSERYRDGNRSPASSSTDNYRNQSESSIKLSYINELDNLLLYIGDYTNVDDLLGSEVPSLVAPVTPTTTGDESNSDELDGDCTKISANQVKIHDGSAHTFTIRRRSGRSLDDTALQLYKDGDYGSYLDLDGSISEQQEEFEGFQNNRRDTIVLRTQLSVRVHTIKEKLLKSEGRELRRALFSLKQVFQEDKDLVHEFVQNDGLDCLIKVGSDVDQNYQNYILRALGQIMLYVDGMNGVMEHNLTIQWLYSLVCSKFRLVIKTALKLLLVFIEYVDTNCLLLIQAIHTYDIARGVLPWTNIMKLLHQFDITDIDVLIYATMLINKTLNGVPDQDTYYDQVDLLEEQNIQSVIQWYMSKQGINLDLLRQFQIYEAVLQHEDGEDKTTPLKQLDESIRMAVRNRKSLSAVSGNNLERRRSRRHSTGTTSMSGTSSPFRLNLNSSDSSDEYRIKQAADGAGVTPGLRRRRERAERQRSLLKEQYENNMKIADSSSSSSSDEVIQNGVANGTPRIFVPSTVNKIESQQQMEEEHHLANHYCNGDVPNLLKRDASVKDMTQKLTLLKSSMMDESVTPPNKRSNTSIVGEMKGIISKAMEGLAKSQSRCDVLRSPSSESASFRVTEMKKSETDLQWEELLAASTRALHLCDLDFTDLKSDDEHDVLAPASCTNGAPPPPPPCSVPPPVPNVPKPASNKTKKTVKLFWKEVREDPIVMTKLNSKRLIWDEIHPVNIDTQRLEHLFESRAKDLITKKQHEMNKNKEIIVLDPKRSNAINIGMTKLPPPRSIKTAILKMDATIMNREGIEKLLTMLPTEEERLKIQEAQAANPELPLGTAEHFLLTLASISELTARLKLWAFKLNYENSEKEIAEPLMDLKQGLQILQANKTFRCILSTLLSIGIFLNGAKVKGFQIEYLSKVPEVKDTVQKHSLLHHLCHIVMEKFPDSTDLYSEIGAVTRASRVDFDELANSILRLEQECKASFDHLKAIAKHDGNNSMKVKISDFLADCAERIIALHKIHRRVINRFYKFCLWLGIPLHRIQVTKANELCRIISEFALEYRTTRERVIQQLEKKASHRERNKTRGKMITETAKFRSQEDKKDAELRQLLRGGRDGNDNETNENVVPHVPGGSLPWRRQRKDIAARNMNSNDSLTDAGDELLESLVNATRATTTTRTAPRERKRTRHAERKSLRRTLRNGLTEEERNYLSTYIKSY